MALITGSPAIGAGVAAYYDGPEGMTDPITTDQRGFALDSSIDIGAFQTNDLVVNDERGYLRDAGGRTGSASGDEPGQRL